MKTLQPVNQKSVYHAAGMLYKEYLETNDSLTPDVVREAVNLLKVMNTSYALELKRAEIENMLKGSSEKTEIRIVEIKNFDQIPLEENNKKEEPK